MPSAMAEPVKYGTNNASWGRASSWQWNHTTDAGWEKGDRNAPESTKSGCDGVSSEWQASYPSRNRWNSSDGNSKAWKKPSSFSNNNAVPAVATLPSKDPNASGKYGSAHARRQRRMRKSMAPVGGGLDAGHSAQEEHEWYAQLTQQLEADSESHLQAVHSLRGFVWKASKDQVGTRTVQAALRTASRSLQDELTQELRGRVRDAIDSPHANFVIQQVVEIMPVACSAFIAQELSGIAAQVSRHRYGCRVIIRLLEHSASEASTIGLVNELLSEVHDLVRHSFGRFVLQAVLEHGAADQRHCIAEALFGDEAAGDCSGMLWNAMNRNASCVFETAMVYCSEQDKQVICRTLLGTRSSVMQLALNQFGSFVLKALLKGPGEDVQAALTVLHDASSELQESKAGRKFLELLSNSDVLG